MTTIEESIVALEEELDANGDAIANIDIRNVPAEDRLRHMADEIWMQYELLREIRRLLEPADTPDEIEGFDDPVHSLVRKLKILERALFIRSQELRHRIVASMPPGFQAQFDRFLMASAGVRKTMSELQSDIESMNKWARYANLTVQVASAVAAAAA